MKIITDEKCTGYSYPGHPERPQRITATVEHLKHQTELPLEWIMPGEVGEEQILRAHTPEMLARLQIPQDFDADTPYFENISTYARASVAAALTALEIARAGGSVFSLMRPPGHHATRQHSMGFCYLNNIAIAVLAAVVVFFSLFSAAGGEGRSEEANYFQLKSPHPNPLPVWAGRGSWI